MHNLFEKGHKTAVINQIDLINHSCVLPYRKFIDTSP